MIPSESRNVLLNIRIIITFDFKLGLVVTVSAHMQFPTHRHTQEQTDVSLFFPALGWSLNHLRSASSCLSMLPTDGPVGGSHFTLLPTYDDGRTWLTNGFAERRAFCSQTAGRKKSIKNITEKSHKRVWYTLVANRKTWVKKEISCKSKLVFSTVFGFFFLSSFWIQSKNLTPCSHSTLPTCLTNTVWN